MHGIRRRALYEDVDAHIQRGVDNIQEDIPDEEKFINNDGLIAYHSSQKYYKKDQEFTVDNVKSRIKFRYPYVIWEDWDGYTSDQFEEPFQNKLCETRIKSDKYYSIYSEFDSLEEVEQVPLKPFDIERDVLDDAMVVAIGRRRSGKTFALRYMAYHLKDRFPLVMVITATKTNNFWAKHVPEEFIYDIEKMDEVLKRLFERQEFLTQYAEDLNVDRRVLLILDDILKEKFKIRFSSQLSHIFTAGRHKGIMTLITIQDPTGITPDMRENTDVVLIFRQKLQDRKLIIERNFIDYFVHHKERERFLWANTGMIDKNTAQKVEVPSKEEGDDGTYDEFKENEVPVALVGLPSKNSENLRALFKVLVAEDPGDFQLGDERYYRSAINGTLADIRDTYYH